MNDLQKIEFNVTGTARKELTNAIGELMGITPKYAGAPRFEYLIGDTRVQKNGEFFWDIRTEAGIINAVLNGLAERGYTFERPLTAEQNAEFSAEVAAEADYAEPTPTEAELANVAEREYAIEPDYREPATEREELGLGVERREDWQGENGLSASDVPDTITIEFPANGVNEQILYDLLNSKGSLIDAALGDDCPWEHEFGTDGLPLTDLPIEFEDGRIKFEWLKFGCPQDSVQAWTTFLAAAVKYSKTQKRVTAKDIGFDEANGKFPLRVFLVKIGLNGPEHKWCRSYLLRNLRGDSAFSSSESKAKWQAKHQKNSVMTQNVEVASDDISE
jgi:hypothetical protein